MSIYYVYSDSISMGGTWTKETNSGDMSRHLYRSNDLYAYASYTFTGTGVAYFAATSSSGCTTAQIEVRRNSDNALVSGPYTVSFKTSTTKRKQLLYYVDKGALPYNTYTIRCYRNSGTGNIYADSIGIFDMANPPTQFRIPVITDGDGAAWTNTSYQMQGRGEYVLSTNIAGNKIRSTTRIGNYNKYYCGASPHNEDWTGVNGYYLWPGIGLPTDTMNVNSECRLNYNFETGTLYCRNSNGDNDILLYDGPKNVKLDYSGIMYCINRVTRTITVIIQEADGGSTWLDYYQGNTPSAVWGNLSPLVDTPSINAFQGTGTNTTNTCWWSLNPGYWNGFYSWSAVNTTIPVINYFVSNKSTVDANDTIIITYSGYDPDGNQIRFQGYIDGVPQGWTGWYTSPQNGLTWGISSNSLSSGSHSFRIEINNYIGGTGTSGYIYVTKSNMYHSTITGNSIPSSMVAGVAYNIGVTVRNDGTDTWTAGLAYSLGSPGDSDPFAAARQGLGGNSVGPGASYTFAFTMTAPTTPATYTTDWQMVRDGYLWFGGVLSKSISVVAKPACVSVTTSCGTLCTTTSYFIYANGVTNATSVRFPTWTDASGQDDLIWHQGIYDPGNNRWYYEIKRSEHGNQNGLYITHVYGVASNGDNIFIGAYNVTIHPNVAPSCSISSSYTGISERNLPLNISISDTDLDQVKYRILLNSVQIQGYTSLANQPINTSYTISNSLFNIGTNYIQVETQDEHGVVILSNILSIPKAAVVFNMTVPASNEYVVNTFICSGTIIDLDGISTVKIYVDDTYIGNASIVNNVWTYNLNTSVYPNGNHTIYAQAICGYTTHTISTRTFVVDNEVPPTYSLSVDRTSTINEPVILTGTITDPNPYDTCKYRILVDNVAVNNWTQLLAQPINLEHTFQPLEFTPPSSTIRVEIMDSRGGISIWEQEIATPDRYTKLLVKDNDDILIWSGNTWTVVAQLPTTESMYSSYGMDDLNAIPSTAWHLLNNPKVLLGRFGTAKASYNFNLIARKRFKLVVSSSIIDFNTSAKIKRIEMNSNVYSDGFVGVLISIDNGSTWRSFNNNEWIYVDPQSVNNKAITKEDLPNITEEQWDLILNNATTLKFGYYINTGTNNSYLENNVESLLVIHKEE